MKCTLSDSLEWLYPDSSIAGEPVTALECDAPMTENLCDGCGACADACPGVKSTKEEASPLHA